MSVQQTIQDLVKLDLAVLDQLVNISVEDGSVGMIRILKEARRIKRKVELQRLYGSYWEHYHQLWFGND